VGTFEELYREHVHAVFRFAYKLARNRATAEDLTAEAFLALFAKLDSVDPAQLPAWLLTVVRNRVIDMWRRAETEKKYSEALVRPPEQPTNLIERWVLDCKDLSPHHRTCLMLRFFHGLSLKEIAENMGVSDTTVKGYLQAGLKKLRMAHKKVTKS
jgi:RNA polymerase sigma-70 factor, ECF subfamily